MIAAQRSIIFTPEILALRRDGNVPDFGHSEAEKGKFTPKEITPLSSVQFISGLLWVAREVENRTGRKVYKNIEKDIGLYSYPLLSIQGHRPLFIFLDYAWRLSRLGLWKYLHFYLYFIVLVCLGPKKADMIIGWIKTSLGYTPRFGAARRLNK
jgi:abequosyltransferase